MRSFQKKHFHVITLAFVLISASLLLATNIIRGQCINKGLELSQLASEVDTMRIKVEIIESERAKIVNKDNLFSLANQRGFTMMSEGKTFNVQ